MAIAPTGDIYKSLSFDNTSSRTYGVYITGEAVYNAPERDVEMITIPGRNGAFALDNGRFQNIEVTYPAGIFAETEADFAQAISDFRNFLCSKEGYCRLTDEYNPNEYRMAVYKSGLEVTPAQLRAGEFSIVFECMPQRWLTSGETAVAVTSGGTLTNPTLFESRPMLEITGYGGIAFNGGDDIAIQMVNIGDVIVFSGYSSNTGISKSITIDDTFANTGDTISGEVTKQLIVNSIFGYVGTGKTISSVSVSSAPDWCTVDITPRTAGKYYNCSISFPSLLFYYGTSVNKSDLVHITATYSDSTTATFLYRVGYQYNGSTSIYWYAYIDVGDLPSGGYFETKGVSSASWVLNSTQSALGNPMYIDLDIGEAWNEDSGTPVSVNDAVSLPNPLPALVSGSNTITYDNTITQLKVVPRWWKI